MDLVRALVVVSALALPAVAQQAPTLPKGWKVAGEVALRDGQTVWPVTDETGAAVDWYAGWTYRGRNARKHHEFLHPKDGAVMIWVPAGDTLRGGKVGVGYVDELPRRTITLAGFYIAKHEVTWKQFLAYCRATGADPPRRPDGAGDDHPVVNVDWAEAAAYCKWVGRRLPTEAEWERAARGTRGRTYPWGDAAPDGSRANFADSNHPEWGKQSKIDDGAARTAPVGKYAAGASPVGALDMAGNVWEWCADWYAVDYYANGPKDRPTGPKSGRDRVDRGGSWDSESFHLRTSYRGHRRPTARAPSLGFRTAR